MRPVLRFLSDDLADRIIDEARDLLSDHGAQVDTASQHAAETWLLDAGRSLVDKAHGMDRLPEAVN